MENGASASLAALRAELYAEAELLHDVCASLAARTAAMPGAAALDVDRLVHRSDALLAEAQAAVAQVRARGVREYRHSKKARSSAFDEARLSAMTLRALSTRAAQIPSALGYEDMVPNVLEPAGALTLVAPTTFASFAAMLMPVVTVTQSPHFYNYDYNVLRLELHNAAADELSVLDYALRLELRAYIRTKPVTVRSTFQHFGVVFEVDAADVAAANVPWSPDADERDVEAVARANLLRYAQPQTSDVLHMQLQLDGQCVYAWTLYSLPNLTVPPPELSAALQFMSITSPAKMTFVNNLDADELYRRVLSVLLVQNVAFRLGSPVLLHAIVWLHVDYVSFNVTLAHDRAVPSRGLGVAFNREYGNMKFADRLFAKLTAVLQASRPSEALALLEPLSLPEDLTETARSQVSLNYPRFSSDILRLQRYALQADSGAALNSAERLKDILDNNYSQLYSTIAVQAIAAWFTGPHASAAIAMVRAVPGLMDRLLHNLRQWASDSPVDVASTSKYYLAKFARAALAALQ